MVKLTRLVNSLNLGLNPYERVCLDANLDLEVRKLQGNLTNDLSRLSKDDLLEFYKARPSMLLALIGK